MHTTYKVAILLLLATARAYTQECAHSKPLGMISGSIQDWQISASSAYPQEWDKGCHEKYARLYQPNKYGWCAKYKSSSEWLQIDLGVGAKVTGVMTQGRGDGIEWVTSFMVSYSMDAFHWQYVTDQYGNQRVFEGNVDSYSVKHSYLHKPISARFIKFHTVHWNKHPSMRVEVVGCQLCKEEIALPPYAKISASSSWSFKKGSSCQPEDGYIMSSKAWCAKHNNENQWLQFDVGPPTLVTGVTTKGRGDTNRKHWVTKFRLSYSNDSRVWFFYKDDNRLNPKNHYWTGNNNSAYVLLPDKNTPEGLEFGGNADKDTARVHYLNKPFTARYIRFHPMQWNSHISMRAGIIGCQYEGSCGKGFMKVNTDTPCIENMAYNKESWINNKRRMPAKRNIHRNYWMHGHAGRAVDGETEASLHSCTILDNFYVEKPVWMVDLGKKTDISGIMIVTWQGKGQEAQKNYREYMYNLDKIVAYVDNKAGKDRVDNPSNMCGFISRLNNALFQPSLHIECSKRMKGRYVYIEAWGAPNRWSRLFSAVLCEVMVYP
ncbi:unnamed protein product [Owenia fusiformis]|uniref:F5/8 type C domain-containing protein n=1 Tax=Owenia fusiformis TaxID=6347 RepID=A0A8S4NVI9_OWEFU|nr:unnamed protein product [Owenia fusiformis]